jgi:hypothetical protein
MYSINLLFNYLGKLAIANNPIIISIFVGGWYTLFNVVKRFNPTQSSKWHNNVLNFVHAVIVSSMLMYKMIIDDENKPDDLIYDATISFFLYDLTRTPINSLFIYHHIISIIGVSMIRIDKYIQLSSKMIITMEIGNLPLYIVCGLMLSRYKQYWTSHKYMKSVMIFEFIWYVLFRCVLPVAIFVNVKYKFYKFIVFGFIFASTWWAKNMYHQLKKY